EGATEIGVVGVSVLCADRIIIRVHEYVGARLQLIEAILVVDVVSAGRPATDDIYREPGLLRQRRRFPDTRQIVRGFFLPRFPTLRMSSGARIRHEALERDAL